MEDLTFPCQICSKNFSTKRTLKNHSYIHDKTVESCDQCGKVFGNKRILRNHKRTHQEREKESVKKCEHCTYESKATNVIRHQKTMHQVRCDECGIAIKNNKGLLVHKRQKHHSMSCVVCGLSFNRCDSLKKHIRTHQDREGSEKTADQTKQQIMEFCCEQCGFKTKRSGNLSRHMRLKHNVIEKKQRTSRQKKYRERLKFMRDVENENFVKRMSATGEQALMDTDIEQIMSARPNMSNRDVAAFLKILKKKLPAKTFALNVKKALEKRSNLLSAYFETEEADLIGKEGEDVKRPVTVAKDLNNLVKMVCSKRDIDEDKSKVVLGVDGGQGKLIITASIIPDDEKERRERAKEANEKDRFKSTGVKRTLVVARVDEVPECYENLEIVMNRLKLRKLSKQFALVCDVKLIDILVGLQGCSSMYPCPYCLGCKLDESGKPTNQKGTFKKGEPRTFQNVKEQFTKSRTKHRNGKFPSRKSLKQFYSVKHLPMQVTNDMEDIPISKMYPPPQLHCGILGLGRGTDKKFHVLLQIPLLWSIIRHFI